MSLLDDGGLGCLPLRTARDPASRPDGGIRLRRTRRHRRRIIRRSSAKRGLRAPAQAALVFLLVFLARLRPQFASRREGRDPGLAVPPDLHKAAALQGSCRDAVRVVLVVVNPVRPARLDPFEDGDLALVEMDGAARGHGRSSLTPQGERTAMSEVRRTLEP